MPRWPLRPLAEGDGADGGGGVGDGAAAAAAGTASALAAAAASTPAAASLAQQRLRVAFEAAKADAVSLGVPRSALPQPQEGASADELAAALAHVQDMVASFLSANI